jgi:5-hydroxyisourate hydrolase-like protein (transthyretin family)
MNPYRLKAELQTFSEEKVKDMIRGSKITISTFALALFFCLYIDSFAYDCAESAPPCQEYWQADAVFVGQVKAKKLKARVEKGGNGEELRVLGGGETRVTFTITEAFRGVSGKEVDIFINESSSYGYGFENGGVYIVYAREYPKGSGKLHTSGCSRTQKYSESSPDIAYAKSLARATPGAVISGAVTHDRDDHDSRGPLANVRVIVTGKDKQVEATTDDEGRYKTPSLPAGEYTVRAEPPQGMSEQERKVTVADRGCAEVFFRPRWDGRLNGIVFDADGRPATGVRIYLVKAEKRGMDWLIYGQSDENSKYEVKGIQPGRYRIVLQHIGLNASKPNSIFYHPGVSDPEQADIISFGEGQVISHFALRLPPLPRLKTIEGIVLDTDGKPLAGVLVSHGQPNANMMSSVKTDEYGRFSFNAYEGVKYSARVIIDLGDGEYAYFKWSDVPADTEKAPMKIVIDPNRPQEKAKLK